MNERSTAPLSSVSPLSRAAALALYAGQEGQINLHKLQGRDEVALTAEPAPGEWSLQRSLQHLLDTQNLLAVRLERMLAGDDPLLVMESTWARAAAAQDTAAMLDEFRRMRAVTVAQLEALPMRAWGRTGRHTEFGRVTVLQQVGYFAYHDAFHLPDFVQKRRQLAGALAR